MFDYFLAYVLFHPILPFLFFFRSLDNIASAFVLPFYLYIFGYLCGKIFTYLSNIVIEKKKKIFPTNFILFYLEYAQIYRIFAIVLAFILIPISLLDEYL